jgi:hypothetical protein
MEPGFILWEIAISHGSRGPVAGDSIGIFLGLSQNVSEHLGEDFIAFRSISLIKGSIMSGVGPTIVVSCQMRDKSNTMNLDNIQKINRPTKQRPPRHGETIHNLSEHRELLRQRRRGKISRRKDSIDVLETVDAIDSISQGPDWLAAFDGKVSVTALADVNIRDHRDIKSSGETLGSGLSHKHTQNEGNNKGTSSHRRSHL